MNYANTSSFELLVPCICLHVTLKVHSDKRECGAGVLLMSWCLVYWDLGPYRYPGLWCM